MPGTVPDALRLLAHLHIRSHVSCESLTAPQGGSEQEAGKGAVQQCVTPRDGEKGRVAVRLGRSCPSLGAGVPQARKVTSQLNRVVTRREQAGE